MRGQRRRTVAAHAALRAPVAAVAEETGAVMAPKSGTRTTRARKAPKAGARKKGNR